MFKKNYLIVYTWLKEENGVKADGIGNINGTFNGKLNFEAMRDLERKLKEEYNYKNVVITNLIEL